MLCHFVSTENSFYYDRIIKVTHLLGAIDQWFTV